MSINNIIEVLVPTQGMVYESPLWDKDSNNIYYLDITGQKLYSLNMINSSSYSISLPQKAGCLALTKNGSLLLGMEDGIYMKDEDTFNLINERIPLAGSRFNDGKIGPDGRFYLGTIRREGGAKFYRLDKDNKLYELICGIKISNGLDWSMDENTLYHIDTPTKKINAYNFDKVNGTISKCRTVAIIPEGIGSPDGMTVDTDDMLWVALWNGGCVVRINPFSGRIIDRIELPTRRVSSCAFVGELLDRLVITTASGGEDDTYLSGCIFIATPGVKGRLPYRLDYN